MKLPRFELLNNYCLSFKHVKHNSPATHISMHIILLAATRLGVEDVDELGEMLEVLGHLGGEDHVDDVVAHLLVCVAVHVLENVHSIVV